MTNFQTNGALGRAQHYRGRGPAQRQRPLGSLNLGGLFGGGRRGIRALPGVGILLAVTAVAAARILGGIPIGAIGGRLGRFLAVVDVPAAAFEVNGRTAHLAFYVITVARRTVGRRRFRERTQQLELAATARALEFVDRHGLHSLVQRCTRCNCCADRFSPDCRTLYTKLRQKVDNALLALC